HKHGVPVDRPQFRPWQAKKIHAALGNSLGDLTRPQRRMELTGFPPNDPLLALTVRARHDLQILLMERHYLACEIGVGRKPSEYPCNARVSHSLMNSCHGWRRSR